MKLRGGALVVGPLFLLACAAGWPAVTADAAVGSWPSAEVDCAFTGAHVAVLSGLAGAGNYNVIIEVKNAPFEPCALPAYPTVDLFDAACPGGKYAATVGGVVIRTVSDGVHFTLAGGEYLAPKIMPAIVAAGRAQAAGSTAPDSPGG